MKKILILLPWLSGYGGTEVVLNNLLKEYINKKNKLNFRIVVYSLGGFKRNPFVNFKDVHIVQLFNNKYLRELLYIFILPFLIMYLIFKEKPNIIIGISPIIWLLPKLLTKIFKMKISTIAWYHYSFAARKVKKIYLKYADYFFVITNGGRKELTNYGIKDNKIFVIYNPVIPSNNTILNSRKHNKFIYVGRIEYKKKKNIKELFIALSKIKQPWELKIYGKGSTKDFKLLKNLSIKLKINKNIHWMGFKKNVFDSIKYADSLILTSNSEGFSMVIAEALSHGLYVISSDCPDGPIELVNSSNGILYKKHDINDLYHSMLYILNNSREFNHNKIKYSISNFYVDNYFSYFSEIINKINN